MLCWVDFLLLWIDLEETQVDVVTLFVTLFILIHLFWVNSCEISETTANNACYAVYFTVSIADEFLIELTF